MKVPFADLTLQYLNLKEDIDRSIADVIRDNAYIGGNGNKYVVNLERDFSDYIGTKYGIGCGNGTDAIEIILSSLNLKSSDEVIVPAMSWYSSAEAVVTAGAKVKFVDVNENFTIDTNKIESAISENTKVILVVHLYGNPVNMTEVMRIAEKHQLFVLEDCAQAHGAMHNGKKVGSIGHASSFSFYPGKNLGAYGDAGMICTNDETISLYAKRARNHGQDKKHQHNFAGRNSRLDGMQAAIVNAKLSSLNGWNRDRLNWAKFYNDEFKGLNGIIVPTILEEDEQVFHLYVIRSKQRDELQKHLTEKGISTAIHYPEILPSLPPFSENAETYPVAMTMTNEILSLPMFPEMTREQFQAVCEAVKSF